MKNYFCCHVIYIAVNHKLAQFLDIHMTIPIGQTRSVGRPKGTKDNDNDEERLKGIHAVVARAHNKAGRHNMSRQELMRLCNEVMTSYEHDEGEMIKRR